MAAAARDRRVLRHVADTIVAERHRRRWSQDDLADAAEISLSTVQRIELVQSDASLTKYVRIARALGLPIAELLQGVDEA